MKKHIYQFIKPVNTCFCQFVDRKVVSSTPKYSLPAVDTNQVPQCSPSSFYSACGDREYMETFKTNQ